MALSLQLTEIDKVVDGPKSMTIRPGKPLVILGEWARAESESAP